MKMNDRIPENGLLLAEGRDRLVFTPYVYRSGKILADGQDCSELLGWDRCLLFDRNTEVRFVRRSARNEIIETVLTADEEAAMDPDLLYTEEVLVKPQYAARGGLPETLVIVNRYRYSENDTLVLDDYRVAMK